MATAAHLRCSLPLPASRCPQSATQRPLPSIGARPISQQRHQPGNSQALFSAVHSQRHQDRCSNGRPSVVPQAFALEAEGAPFLNQAADGAPLNDGFGSDHEVVGAAAGQQRQQQRDQPACIVHRLRLAAGHARVAATHAAQQLKALTLRLANFVAKSLVVGVAAQLAQRQRIQRAAAQQQAAAAAKLAVAAAARVTAAARLQQGFAQRSKADRAFVKMLLSQDNPGRSLEAKWGDLCRGMRSKDAPEFRKRTADLFSAALDSSHAVQLAMVTEAAKGTQALDRLVSQHDCTHEEEELRSMLFAQILNGMQT